MHIVQPLAPASRDGAVNAQLHAEHLTISVLGPLLVRCQGVPTDIAPAKVRTLLGLLALDPTRAVARNEITEILWEGDPPATFVSLIQVYVSRLRAQLRQGLVPGAEESVVAKSNGGGYQLKISPDAVDLVRFDRLLQQARQAADGGDTTAATGAYETALRLWRGPILEDLDPRFAQLPVVVSAHERRILATLELARVYGRAGHHQQAVETLRALTKYAPHHESLHAQLMRALAATGERGAALATFEEIRHRLADEYGVDPGVELQEVHLQLLRDVTPPASKPDPESSIDILAGGPKPPRRPSRRQGLYASIATYSAVLVLALAVGLFVGYRQYAPRNQSSASPSVAVAAPTSFVAIKQWQWAYGPSLGTTAGRAQWASAHVSGLGIDGGVAGFRLRVGADPEGKGAQQGVMLGVCQIRYEIEGDGPDLQHIDTSLPAEGDLRVEISATNLVTIIFDNALVGRVQLHSKYNGGLNIVPAIWNSAARVVMTDVRSNARPRPASGVPQRTAS